MILSSNFNLRLMQDLMDQRKLRNKEERQETEREDEADWNNEPSDKR